MVLVYLYLFVVLRTFISVSLSFGMWGRSIKVYPKHRIVYSEQWICNFISVEAFFCDAVPNHSTPVRWFEWCAAVTQWPVCHKNGDLNCTLRKPKNSVLFTLIMSRFFCGTQNVVRRGKKKTYLVKGYVMSHMRSVLRKGEIIVMYLHTVLVLSKTLVCVARICSDIRLKRALVNLQRSQEMGTTSGNTIFVIIELLWKPTGLADTHRISIIKVNCIT